MSVAISLSGGGAHGDFQVGAVKYLYSVGVSPDILCGTSVGSINAAKLAEGEGDPSQGLQGLEAIWLSLRSSSDMWLEEDWLGDIDPAFKALLTGKGGPGFTAPSSTTFNFPQPWDWNALVTSLGQLSWLSKAGVSYLQSLDTLRKAYSIYNINPIAWKLFGNSERRIPRHLFPDRIRTWSDNGRRKLRLATVGLDSGLLRYITETGLVLERDNASIVQVSDSCQDHWDAIEALNTRKEHLAAELASTNDKTEVIREIADVNERLQSATEGLNVCLSSTERRNLVVNVEDGVIASSSIAGIFPPRLLGPELYIDGGFRMVMPIEVAVKCGANQIFAISASKFGINPGGPFGHKNLLDFVSRGLTEIAVDELSYRDIIAARSWNGVQVNIVAPTIDLHDIYTIDPGLIRIAIDYGFMRAEDVYASAASELWASSDAIAQLRKNIWRLECLYDGHAVPTDTNSSDAPPNPSLRASILTAKASLADLIAERYSLGGTVPDNVVDAASQAEAHPWASTLSVPIIVVQKPPKRPTSDLSYVGLEYLS